MRRNTTKKLRLKESVKNAFGITLFYLLIVVGVIVLNARMADVNGDPEYNNTNYTNNLNK